MSVTALLRFNQSRNLVAVDRLFAGLPAASGCEQPGGVVNHPVWTLGHLNHYHGPILALAQGEPVTDPRSLPTAATFDEGSRPVAEPGAYPSLETLLAAYLEGHERLAEALRAADESAFDRPPRLARWVDFFGTTGNALSYLLVQHEAWHLGEIAVWRHAMGLPAAG